MKTANEIRSLFLDYFHRHGHTIVPSSPLVPRNDPSLLFTNAGMVQFKNVFTGAETLDYSRAVTSQKCVRAGGKHNDLENVGYTARHHTFFEMLGNFSFGNYFKADAIDLAWRLITEEFALPADKLLVTVYADDDDAAALWKKIAGLPDDRILRIASSDNFWSMGDTGPCGPCSEIFFDHGEHLPGGPPGSPDEDGDRFVEIWNLVFMQYDQQPEGRSDLPHPSIDTGMGLERIAAVLQGKHDNYDTDLMRTLIEASADAVNGDPDGPGRISHRVIADHLRAAAFLIADGVLPSNEGRGYVLRRIMRRAMRHAHLLGAHDPLLFRLLPRLVGLMGQAFPELTRAQDLISETLKLEETRFKQTLERGLKLLEEETASLGSGDMLSGEVAFRLYDTYGFPLDLTQDALRPRHIDVDVEGFQEAMERQRAEARRAWSGSGEAATAQVWFTLRDRLGATEFLGYSSHEASARVTALVNDAGEEIDSADPGASVLVVVNQTPFYGESGGQIGDTGRLTGPGDLQLTIDDTQRMAGDLMVHHARVDSGRLQVGELVTLTVDGCRRARLRANHSATHLLHQALRRVLGPHVTQKGSLVTPERLRFDFAQPKAMTEEELARVEVMVNERIRLNGPVTTRLMTPDDAIAAGALALFGEKYGEEVRVVAMGGSEADDGQGFSVELCGGTHVHRTGEIGLFKLVAESAVAGGVRRVEALTGEAALLYLNQRDQLLLHAADALRTRPEELPGRIAQVVEDRRRLEREVADLRKQVAMGGGGGETERRTVKDVAFAPRKLQDVPAKDLKGMADELKTALGSGVVALASVADGKVSLVVGVTEDLTGRVSAVDLVRAGSAAVGGKGGGGRPDMAQAGGPEGADPDAALAAMEQALADAL